MLCTCRSCHPPRVVVFHNSWQESLAVAANQLPINGLFVHNYGHVKQLDFDDYTTLVEVCENGKATNNLEKVRIKSMPFL